MTKDELAGLNRYAGATLQLNDKIQHMQNKLTVLLGTSNLCSEFELRLNQHKAGAITIPCNLAIDYYKQEIAKLEEEYRHKTAMLEGATIIWPVLPK